MARNIDLLEKAASLLGIPAHLLEISQSRCFEIIDHIEENGELLDESAEARALMVAYWES